MTKYKMTFECKDKKTLQKFFVFLSTKYKTKLLKLQTPLTFQRKKTKIKRITVLKSPHVNKTAQRHFEYRIYSIVIQIYSSKPQKYLFILKKIQNHLFPEVKIKITQIGNKRNSLDFVKNRFLNPNIYETGLNTNLLFKTQKLDYKKNKKRESSFLNHFNQKILKSTLSYILTFDKYGKLEN